MLYTFIETFRVALIQYNIFQFTGNLIKMDLTGLHSPISQIDLFNLPPSQTTIFLILLAMLNYLDSSQYNDLIQFVPIRNVLCKNFPIIYKYGYYVQYFMIFHMM